MPKRRSTVHHLLSRWLLLALFVRALTPLLAPVSEPGYAMAPLIADICSASHVLAPSSGDDGGKLAPAHDRGDHCLICGGVGMAPPSAEFRFSGTGDSVPLQAPWSALPTLPSTYGGFQFQSHAPPVA